MRQLLGRLFRLSPVILAFVVIGGVLGLWAQDSIAPRYTSSVTLLLDPKRADSFGADSQFANLYVDSTKIASVVTVMQSAELLGRVVESQDLADDPEFGKPSRSLLRRWLSVLPFAPAAPDLGNDPKTRTALATYQLGRSLRVNRLGLTYALTVEVTAGSPETARRLAQAVTDSYIDDQLRAKAAATQRDSVWLSDRMTELRRNLLASEQAVEEVRKKYGLLETNHGPGDTVDRQLISELETHLSQARAEVSTKRARYGEAERLHGARGSLESLPEATASPVIGELRKHQADVVRRIAALRSVYNDSYPELLRAQDDLRTVDAQIAAEARRIGDGLRTEYEVAAARERALSEDLTHTMTREGGAESSEGRVQLREAQRIVDANRGLYESLVNRWKEIAQQQTREDAEARVIAQASLPDAPSWPKPLLLPALGCALGMALGLGLTVVLPYFNGGFASVGDVEGTLGLPVLGLISLLRRRDLAFAKRRLSITDYAIRKPRTRFAESLRMLRVSLRISDSGPARLVQVTSSVTGEGKSTVAAALAISAAMSGIRTVLVDADIRNPSVSSMLHMRADEGLADVLTRDVRICSVLQRHPQLSMAVLAAGSSTERRADLIGGQRFGLLLRELARDFELIVLDGPPVLAVSDALAIAGYADMTLLVVQWRTTARALVNGAVKALRKVNAPLTGVILNKVDLSKANQYAYDYAQARQDSQKYFQV